MKPKPSVVMSMVVKMAGWVLLKPCEHVSMGRTDLVVQSIGDVADLEEQDEPHGVCDVAAAAEGLFAGHADVNERPEDQAGAQLVEGLELSKLDRIIEKGQDKRVEMHSVFYDPFKVSDSGTSAALKAQGITWVYVVGLAYDYCVKASALDAKAEGFEVVIIRDGTRAVDPSAENIQRLEKELTSQGIHIVSKEDESVQWVL